MKKKRFIDVIEVCTNDSHLFSGDIWREREREWRYSIEVKQSCAEFPYCSNIISCRLLFY